MNEQKCAVCGKLMNLVKAGVSQRTGKPYDAFYSCPDRCKQPKGINTAGKDAFTVIAESLEEINKKLDILIGGKTTAGEEVNDSDILF